MRAREYNSLQKMVLGCQQQLSALWVSQTGCVSAHDPGKDT